MVIERIINREMFFNILDSEVERARRYQNFFSILKLKLSPLPGLENEDRLKTCWKTLRDLLAKELRRSDTLGFLGKDQWAVIIPYADFSAVALLQTRIMGSLEHFDFKKKGYEVATDLISFPIHGTNTVDLLKKI